MVNRDKF